MQNPKHQKQKLQSANARSVDVSRVLAGMTRNHAEQTRTSAEMINNEFLCNFVVTFRGGNNTT
ncbi:hypothetical protein A2215_00540 [Candidatus Berkelbacteria bacterium RIFOXYA2_FULL_43_10]|uniref:Uncharacterized protein n=1 Tax=Candidatus Berkelbacteria bacterium RIFOXYA2_FULL_43_10 TaxID=1797472 RepID=A0A1F5E3Z9_9BACT|nr:MAG: hypothetical protein A2215_00540 [Candidatus Berkelbacteria bacterium RIFOXYA2_FULL_43_10]